MSLVICLGEPKTQKRRYKKMKVYDIPLEYMDGVLHGDRRLLDVPWGDVRNVVMNYHNSTVEFYIEERDPPGYVHEHIRFRSE